MASTATDQRQSQDIELQLSETSTTKREDPIPREDGSEPKSTFMRVCKNFSTVWSALPIYTSIPATFRANSFRFTVCMDTGVLSIILHQFPYPSHWTRVCSTILFVLNLVLFLLFITIYLLRWTVYRTSTFSHTSVDAEEIALQACPIITWLTLTIQVQLICAQSWGYGFTILAFVMWWISLLWIKTTLNPT